MGAFGASLRVAGLLVGRRSIGARLGYGRHRMQGPLPVKLMPSWLFRDGRYVDWDRVRTVEADRVLISGPVDSLPRSGPST